MSGVKIQCPECDGLGLHHMDDSPYYPCPTCGDRGWVRALPKKWGCSHLGAKIDAWWLDRQ